MVAAAVLPNVALPNATRLPSQDAWVVARGYAAIAGVSSSAAVYYNPAGLADVGASEVRAGLHVIATDISFTSAATGRRVEEQSDTFYQPHVFAAVPLGKSLTLGAGVYSPFGQSTDWAPTSGFGGAATFNEIKYVTGAVALAWKASNSLSLGFGLQHSRAEGDLNRLQAISPTAATAFRFEGDDAAFSGNVGVKWRPAPGHTLGFHYQRQTSFVFEGTASLAGVAALPGSVAWAFPENIAVGWQWDFLPGWQGEVAVDWTNWERVNTLHLSAGPLSSALPLNWKASSYYGVGVTRQCTANVSVSAGYNYSENSVPDSSLTPALPDVDRHLLSGGVFWNAGRWQIGAVLQHGFKAERTVRGPAPDGLGGSFAGRFENALWAGELSVALKF